MRVVTGTSTGGLPPTDEQILNTLPKNEDGTTQHLWVLEFIRNQIKTHPAPFIYDPATQQYLVSLEPADQPPAYIYPTQIRFAVTALMRLSEPIKRYLNRFKPGQNPKTGIPKFVTTRDALSISTRGYSGFDVETPNLTKFKERYTAAYVAEHQKQPTKKQVDEATKTYKNEWHQKHPTPRAKTLSRFKTKAFGNIPVVADQMAYLHRLMYPKGVPADEYLEFGNDYRVLDDNGKLWIVVTLIHPTPPTKTRPAAYYLNPNKTVGLDRGVIKTIHDSDNRVIPNIHRVSKPTDPEQEPLPDTPINRAFLKTFSYLKKSQKNLDELERKKIGLQREASKIWEDTKTSLGEENPTARTIREALPDTYQETQKRIQRIQRRINTITAHHQNVITKWYAATNDVIVTETLTIKHLLARHQPKLDDTGTTHVPNGQTGSQVMRRNMARAKLAELKTKLEQKANMYGTRVETVGQRFPSSQLCSKCGARKKIGLGNRDYECDNCGQKIDRDYNAALNILQEGMKHLADPAYKLPETTPEEEEEMTKRTQETLDKADAENTVPAE